MSTREIPVRFGEDRALIGVITPATARSCDVGLIVFNAGVIHRVGPHRLNVKLARTLAGSGVTTLRFDLGGVGDSRAAQGGGEFRDQAVHDLRTAMDLLEREHGLKRFMLFGICSGAVHSFRAALADPRVGGVLMFDGYWYRTRWTEPMRLWKRFRALPWTHVVKVILNRLRPRDRGNAAAQPGVFDAGADMANPPKAEFAASLRALDARGVDVFFLYGGSVMDYYSYAGQFRDAFRGEPFLERVRCELHESIDHTVVALETQRKLIALITGWACAVVARARS